MNRSFSRNTSSPSARCSNPRNCRTSLGPLRRKRDALTETFDEQWREIRRHATVETDPKQMLRLAAELERRRQAERANQRIGRYEGKS
jgi:hypothetical protein